MNTQLGIEFDTNLTNEERTVLGALRSGRAGAMSAPHLASLVGISERELRATINHLIIEHGQPIGSVSAKPAGYFLVETEKDLELASNNLHKRAMSVLVRYAALKRVSFETLLGQLCIDQVKR